jgi:hypothetical protein
MLEVHIYQREFVLCAHIIFMTYNNITVIVQHAFVLFQVLEEELISKHMKTIVEVNSSYSPNYRYKLFLFKEY